MNIAFDVTLSAVIRVDVPDSMARKAAIACARKAVLDTLDCLDVGMVREVIINGQPVVVTMTEASHADEMLEAPFEIDGEDPEAAS